eukprot:6179851-Pleurochrysis_carterae.AAC.1
MRAARSGEETTRKQLIRALRSQRETMPRMRECRLVRNAAHNARTELRRGNKSIAWEPCGARGSRALCVQHGFCGFRPRHATQCWQQAVIGRDERGQEHETAVETKRVETKAEKAGCRARRRRGGVRGSSLSQTACAKPSPSTSAAVLETRQAQASVAFWRTPNRCSSSMMSRPRFDHESLSVRMACVPMRSCTSPEATSACSSARCAAVRLVMDDMISTRTSGMRALITRRCWAASTVVGARKATCLPAQTAR